MIIPRQQLADMLLKWQAGEISAEQLHGWAAERYFPGSVEFADREEDESSTANEVLAALDQLPANLIVAGDVPIYLTFLATPLGQFEQGYAEFATALQAIDYAARRRELQSDPVYRKYCD